jgi:HSP20 family protein
MLRPLQAAFVDLQRQLDELFDEMIYRPWAVAAPPGWRPPLDCHETADAYIVEIDLPGISPDEVSVRATAHGLTIAGRRRMTRPPETFSSRSERPSGEFCRSLSFPTPVVPEECQAECCQGVYRIRVPRRRQGGEVAEGEAPVERVIRVTAR